MPRLRERMLPLIMFVFALVVIGTLFYALFEGWSYIDAFYFTVMTLTTVGYGDMFPTTPLTKMFTVFFVLIGVYMIFYALTLFTRYYIDKKTPCIHRAVTQSLENLVHRHKRKGEVVLKVEKEENR